MDYCGHKIEDDGNEFTAHAPKGHVWACSGDHELLATYDDADERADALEWLKSDIDEGTERCPHQPRCETCDGEPTERED